MATVPMRTPRGARGAPRTRGTPRTPYAVQVPGVRRPVGLGDAVAAVTSRFGIDPCETCEQRRERLNRWLALHPTRRPW